MTLSEALAGKEIPDDIRKDVALVSVPFFSFNGEAREGFLVVHKELAHEVQQIFKKLSEMQFPIQKIIPIVAYGWDDDVSMAGNNTSAFNYRYYDSIASGTRRLSIHSYGRAIDINPFQNPQERDGVITPSGAFYDPTKQGTLTPEIASIFKSYGWEWGGDWVQLKDWHHFEKPVTKS